MRLPASMLGLGMSNKVLSQAQISEIESLVRDVMNLDKTTAVGQLEAAKCAAWDSLRHVELVLKLQSRFNIKLSSAELVNMRSVEQIKSTVLAHLP